MSDFDGIIDPPADANATVPSLSQYAKALAGPNGPLNAQAIALTKRLKAVEARDAGDLPVDDGSSGSLFTTVQGGFDELRSDDGTDFIGNKGTATGEVALKLGPYLNLEVKGLKRNFGAALDGVTDDTPAWNKAIASGKKTVEIEEGTVLLSTAPSSIVLPVNFAFRGQSKFASIVKKAFNGNFASLSQGAGIQDLTVNLQGASFTGKGVICTGTDGKQRLVDVRLIDGDDHCLYFDIAAGSGFSARDCEMYRVSAGTGTGRYAVAIADSLNLAAVPRKFFGLETGGTCSISFGGSNNTYVVGSFLADLQFSTNSRFATIASSRIANAAALTINGANHSIVGCDVNPQITLAAGTDNCVIGPNSYNNLPILDNSGNARNLIYAWALVYTPTLTSGGTPPTLGNGSITGTYTKTGATTTISGELSIGSTTSLGTGGLSISLPQQRRTMDVFVGGTVYMNRGGVLYAGYLQIAEAATTASLLRDTTGSITFNSPAVFASGDIIRWSMTYRN